MWLCSYPPSTIRTELEHRGMGQEALGTQSCAPNLQRLHELVEDTLALGPPRTRQRKGCVP